MCKVIDPLSLQMPLKFTIFSGRKCKLKGYSTVYILYTRGRHLDPENRDFGIGIEKNGVGTGRDGVFPSRFFQDGTGLKKIEKCRPLVEVCTQKCATAIMHPQSIIII